MKEKRDFRIGLVTRIVIMLAMAAVLTMVAGFDSECYAAGKTLAKPKITSVTSKEKKITVKWKKVSGAAEYIVRVKKDGELYLESKPIAKTKYVFNGVYDHKYSFSICGVDDNGKQGPFSKAKSIGLVKAPQKVRIRGIDEDEKKIVIRTYTCTGATNFEVYVSKDNADSFEKVATVKAKKQVMEYKYKKPDPNATYYIKVRGVNKCKQGTGYGEFCDIRTTEKIIPIVKVNRNKITVTWNSVMDINKYTVQCNEFYKEGFKKKTTTKKLKYTFKGNYATSYKLRIEGVTDGNAKLSETICFETGSHPDLDYDRICTLPSYEISSKYDATSVNGITFVGNDLWYLKSAIEDAKEGYPMVLGKIENFNPDSDTQNPPATIVPIVNKDGSLYYGAHGSSITYYDGYFYIIACGSKKSSVPLIKVAPDGVIQCEVPVNGFAQGDGVSAIDYYGIAPEDGAPLFILRDGRSYKESTGDDGGRHKFSVGALENDELVCRKVFITDNEVGTGDKRCNDIDYDPTTGILYQTSFVYDADGKNISHNSIYAFKATDQVDRYGRTIMDTVYVKKIDLAPKSKTSETKLEVEGIEFRDGHLYIGCNTDGIYDDGLYRVR